MNQRDILLNTSSQKFLRKWFLIGFEKYSIAKISLGDGMFFKQSVILKL